MTQYRVLQGIDYPPNKRAEAGDVVNDLPASSVKWLLEVGAIEDASKPKSEPKVEIAEEPVIEEPEVEPVKEEPIVEAPVEPVVEAEGFDPDAKDGDGDGFLQDGTPHQRPVEETE
ncbi:hypothetical protein uvFWCGRAMDCOMC203_052 [Freshwater phage uvFW-CGR-AMD-COM-C203]|nr:hypothetical protein uvFWCGRAMDCOMC203_052 [Freshwater phage uvFW-CGR-AMD-COM-C203]